MDIIDRSLPQLEQSAIDTLSSVFGYDNFRPLQLEIIKSLCQGQDVLAIMPTGGGKSICYQVPSLMQNGTGIVISPLIALMDDQVSALKLLGIRAERLHSGLDSAALAKIEFQLLSHELDILYIAPERILSNRMISVLQRCQIALFAIDEAHCVSQWGHDFRPEYQQLAKLKDYFPKIPSIALTATADEKTQLEIISQLGLHQAQRFSASFDRPNIHYSVYSGQNYKSALLQFIRVHHGTEGAGIVYCQTRKKVDAICAWLIDNGFDALPYHAGMSDEIRFQNQQRFKNEDGIIMVATIAFGMGIDKPNVRFVAHTNLPKCLESYYQETGRAGRDGNPAYAWMSLNLEDITTLRRLMYDADVNPIRKQINHNKLEYMLGFCESTGCRRESLLSYFGESYSPPCHNCDNCLFPPKTLDESENARIALSCIYRSGQRFGVNYIIDLLLGKESDKVLNNRHHLLSTFGMGKHLSAAELRNLIRQLLTRSFIVADPENYGGLRLTEKCRPLLRQQESFYCRIPDKQREKADVVNNETISVSDYDQALFECLKTLRATIAAESQVPAYVIFHNKTLQQISKISPTSLVELKNISGIGEKKLQLYGEILIKTISEFKSTLPQEDKVAMEET